ISCQPTLDGNEEIEEDVLKEGTTRKRGTVYRRKLTMLPPGENLNVEFDEDGNAIGLHASFFFLGLKTKEEHLENKPSEMKEIEWKFLVDHWSDEKFKEKSKKASESWAHQKMSHHNGTKSFARLRQEIVFDVLVASRTRKSKKAMNVITLEKNTLAVPTQELIKVKKKADQLVEEARKDAENARTEAEQAKKEAEAVRINVDRKIENAIWKRFYQLMNFIKGVLTQTMMIQEIKAHHDEVST
ncbi:M-agglutinin, partial [Bienertia sinuspersici]